MNAVLKLEEANNYASNDSNEENNIIDSKQQYIVNCIKNVNDCIEVLKIQMSNNHNKIEQIYGEVIEKANKYKDLALNTISQVYETKFAVLNVKLNKFKKMQQKIQQVWLLNIERFQNLFSINHDIYFNKQYKENGEMVMDLNQNQSLYSEIVSFKENGNVMDTINNTDLIQIKIQNDNLDEYIKNILSVNDLNSIILPPKINIIDIHQDCISLNISNDIKDTELNITKYELKFSEQSHFNGI